MYKILVVFCLLSSVFFIVFALVRAVPAKAQAGSAIWATKAHVDGGLGPNAGRAGKAKAYGLTANIWIDGR